MATPEQNLDRLDKVANLKQIVKFIEDTPSVDDFLKLAGELVRYVKDIDARLTNDFKALADKLNELPATLTAKAKQQVDDVLAPIKASVEKRLNEAILQFTGQVATLEDDARAAINYLYDKADALQSVKGDPGEPGKQGPAPTNEQLLALITPLIPKAVAPARVQTPAKVYRIANKDVSDQCDGSNKLFNIGSIHFGIEGVYGTQAPIIYRPIIDYVETARGIQLTDAVTAPEAGQTLIIKYMK